MQIQFDQLNLNRNHLLHRNSYGNNQLSSQQYHQQPQQNSASQKQIYPEYSQQVNSQTQSFQRPTFINERKVSFDYTGELPLDKNQNYKQMNGGRLSKTRQVSFDNQNSEAILLNNKIEQNQDEVGSKNILSNEFAQAEFSLRLLKKKIQNRETNQYKFYNSELSKENFRNVSEKNHQITTDDEPINSKRNHRRIFKVDQQTEKDTLIRQKKESEDYQNEFLPSIQVAQRERGVLQQRSQQNEQNNDNSAKRDEQKYSNLSKVNNGNQIRRSLNFNSPQKEINLKQAQYPSSMKRALEKKDPQMMYNAQRFSQMQNYEYTKIENDNNDDDFVFMNKNVPKKSILQNKQQPSYGYESSSINNNNKKQFSSQNIILKKDLQKKYSLKDSNNSENQLIKYQNEEKQEQQPIQKKHQRVGSYRGEINGQKYYNFSKNAEVDQQNENDENTNENAQNQKFIIKQKQNKYKTNDQNQNNETEKDENILSNNNAREQNYNIKSINKKQEQVEQPIEQPIEPKQNMKEKSQYNLNDMDEQEVNIQNNEDLVECPEGCGRRFAPESLQKHSKICKKVFQKKRVVFDMKKQRMQDEEQEQLLEQSEMEEKLRNKYQNKNKSSTNTNQDKKSKWRIQSEQFRAILKNNNGSNNDGIAQEQPQYDDRVECPHCKRKFNEQTYNKHEPICGNRAKIAKAAGKRFGRK